MIVIAVMTSIVQVESLVRFAIMILIVTRLEDVVFLVRVHVMAFASNF